MKRVKDIIKETSVVEPTSTETKTDTSQQTQTQSPTGGGRVSPSTGTLERLQKSDSDGFISGYVSDMTIKDLEKYFGGTSINPTTVSNLSSEVKELELAHKEANQNEIDAWSRISSELDNAYARVNAALAQGPKGDPGPYYKALFDIQDLWKEFETYQQKTFSASKKWYDSVQKLGTYVRGGKPLPKDPFQLDDPTVARSQKEKRKRDDEIKKEIEKLNREASDNQKAAQLNKLKAYGLGALVAGVAALGVAALFIPAVNAALGPALIGALRAIFKVGDDVIKGIRGSVDDIDPAGLGNVMGQVADDAANIINKLLKGSGGEAGGQGRTLANQIQRAVDDGDVELVKKLIKSAEKYLYNSYNPQGQVLAENRKRILREIKKPVVVPEIPKQKYKMNFSGKYSSQNTPDKTASKLSDDLVASGNARGQRWRAEDKYWQGYETTERMNIIFDRVGHGDQYWDEIVNENMRKNSWKTKEMQEHLNIMAHEKAMKEENPNYDSPFYKEFIEEQETVQADKDPLFKKVAKKLKKEIDYSDKPSKSGVPNEPPPEMVNGYHPDFGKRKAYYNKLDPQSAEAMPETGDAEIDASVEKAKRQPKKGIPAKANPPKGT